MHRISSTLLSLILITTSFPGCTVLEDRRQCPCHLFLDLSSCSDREDLEIVVAAGEQRSRFHFPAGSGVPPFVKIEVPKGQVGIAAFAPASEISFDAYLGLDIPTGEQCPPLWSDISLRHLTREREDMRVLLRKNYCRLEVRALNTGSDDDYRATFYGNVRGVAPDGSPLAGEFSCSLVPTGGGDCALRLPRQSDSSLSMQIETGAEGVLRTFAVGEYLDAAGYDWSEADLQDASITIDFQASRITVRHASWVRTFAFDLRL